MQVDQEFKTNIVPARQINISVPADCPLRTRSLLTYKGRNYVKHHLSISPAQMNSLKALITSLDITHDPNEFKHVHLMFSLQQTRLLICSIDNSTQRWKSKSVVEKTVSN